jgi:hypothetical protein
MELPDVKLVSKKPAVFKCPACSQTFHIASYKGTGKAKLAQFEADYAKHFKDSHSREDASQAAARIVREATKD